MIELFAGLWDWLKDHAAYTSLYLVGVLTGLFIAWLLARADEKRRGQ